MMKWLDNVQFAKSSHITFAVALVLAILAVLVTWHDPQIVTTGYKNTETGPIGAADRDMLYKVKQAGLWEMPVGHELSKSPDPDIAALGAKISVEHMQLDTMTERIANELDVKLPAEASPDQQRWVDEIAELPPGAQQDKLAIFYLRRAHGNVLPVLAQVKAGTRNAEVREFATEASVFVTRHMSYLDESGLVDYSQLPEPPTPSPYQQPAVASFWDSRDVRSLVVTGIVIAVLGVLLAAIVVPLVQARQTKKSPKPATGGKRRRKR